MNTVTKNMNEEALRMASMRAGFGEGLVLAGEEDKDVVVLCADLSESTQVQAFQKKFPERFIEVGVAEQNLATVASGMAAMGKKPFIASYAVFSPGRNWEQIRTTVCYNDLPVKIIGSHAGLSVGPDGGSHQSLEDMALMRALPRMTVISPCDAIEAKKAAIAMARLKGPAYVRLGREKTPVLTSEKDHFEIGKASYLFKPQGAEKYDVGIICTGALSYEAVLAAKKLESEGRRAAVLNMSTIKPLDGDSVTRLAGMSGCIVTVEDHQITGGLGGAVAEYLALTRPVPVEFVGVKDQFGQSGTAAELYNLYGLDSSHIFDAAKKAILRK